MLTVYTLGQASQWDAVVRSFESYDVYYLSGYVSAFMQQDEAYGIPMLLLYKNRNDRAINVVFKRDISKDKHFQGKLEENRYFDLISPYGYGGFIGDIEDYEVLNKEYYEYCMENHYICEFVRFNLFSDYYLHYPGQTETRIHNIVRNLEMPLDAIWMDFKQKVRKNVKRANSYGLEIIIDDAGNYMEDFLRIYYSTMERTKAEKQFFFKKQFFESIMSIKNNATMFHACYENRIISTELVLYGAKNAYSYLGGTDSSYYYTRANDFLKYEIIRWSINKGLSNFVLGGGHGSDDGIYQYKINLSPHGIKNFYIGKNIFDSESYKSLIKIRNWEKPYKDDTGFFPQYRA